MSDTGGEEALEEAFSAVADETRFGILRALWAAHTEDLGTVHGPTLEPVSFSRLRERAGVQDSGRFNYHLDRLVPRFVRSQAGGYVLTDAGARAVGAAVSGVYTGGDTSLDTTEMDDCTEPDCSGTLRARYTDGRMTVECGTCQVNAVVSVPPVVVETHDIGTDPDTVQRFALTRMQRIVRGFCTLCSGPLDRAVVGPLEESDDARVTVTHTCEECGNVVRTTAVVLVTDHPAVVSLLDDAGIDYRDIAFWRRPQGVEYRERLRNEDPLRVAVVVTVENECLTLVMDEHLQVVERHRESV
jgi:hypothetical protein